jgi:hypothetical protein
MQFSIYSVERLAEFQQAEAEREARELWKWSTLCKKRLPFIMALVKLFV